MTSSSRTDLRIWLLGGALGACLLFAGCIADTAEDSDLPWSSNKSWEGMAPIAPSIMNQYD
ncbi:MAG TPA: hypothetical protein DD637_05835 [Verrucomicrobia bacterium]|mgnify:CR=1 FL=1|nr:hypothetical protein [Verrucomicrobiota bacterium]HCG19957.1 hypothetical protein [Verrucomicrobiota bacterium]